VPVIPVIGAQKYSTAAASTTPSGSSSRRPIRNIKGTVASKNAQCTSLAAECRPNANAGTNSISKPCASIS
jgi:hypothetical protein